MAIYATITPNSTSFYKHVYHIDCRHIWIAFVVGLVMTVTVIVIVSVVIVSVVIVVF